MPNSAELPAAPPLEPLIFPLRGHRVILDADLARLYEVTTGRFNEAFKRNIHRFPSDFAFQLIPEELEALRRSQNAIALHKFRNPRFLAWAFTEHGALMAANMLRSERAVQMSVYVVRAFMKLRQAVLENEGLSRRMAEAELALREHDAALADMYDKLEPLLDPPAEQGPTRVMGFTRDG
jgi:hypothetical protein